MPPYVKKRSFSTAPEGIDFSSREMYNDKKRRGYGGIGRRARFRFLWQHRAGSSPVTRTIKADSIIEILSALIFYKQSAGNRT